MKQRGGGMPRRDDDDRRDDDRRRRCWPHFGNLHERVEVIKRTPPDDAREFLRTIILLAFFEGVNCGREEECECMVRWLRAHCCCKRHEHHEEWWRDRDRDDDDDRGNGDRRR